MITIYQCGYCGYTTEDIQDLDLIDDMAERVEVGEIHPAGQCPECKAIVPAPDGDVVACVGLNYMATLLRANGYSVEEPG